MKIKQEHDRRLNGGSWAAILYAGAIFLLLAVLQVYVWTLPTDGWSTRPSGNDAESHFLPELQADVASIPSGLQPGDVVTHIDGVPATEYVVRAFHFWQYGPPDWQSGQMLRYRVLRDATGVATSDARSTKQQLDVDVPIQVLGPAGHILGSFQVAVGVSSPGAALLEVIASVAFALVSLVIFILRPREPASGALLIIGVPFFFQHVYVVQGVTTLGYPLVTFVSALFSTWILAILPAFLYLMLAFPRPTWLARRFPRATPLLVFGFAWLCQLGPLFVYPGDTMKALSLLATTGWAGMLYLLLPLVIIARSLFTERDPVARARLTWVVLGVIGFIAGGLAFGLGQQAGWSLVVSLIQNGGYLMLPVCLGIAIVRHRLFDIDVIIRRTLVYAIVTALLAGVFYGGVLVLQRVFTGLSGQASPIAIVASTLAIAALFSPVRRRVQDFVDRRFYRRKYDAQQVLARFAITTQHETELDALTGAILHVVEETVKPDRVGLWLNGERT